MAYNFLGLVNNICSKVNEVPLTSATFNNQEGFYTLAKEAINRAIFDINLTDYFWRFNFTQYNSPLVAGQMRYVLPATSKVIDFDSFKIKQSDVLNTDTSKLYILNYDEYNEKWSKHEYFTTETAREKPRYVVKTPGNDFIVVPSPDKAYDLVFDYYVQPVALEDWDDVPTIPERYSHVIFYGAMRDVYHFREDEFSVQMMDKKFTDGIRNMRQLEINLYDYVRSGMYVRDVTGNSGFTHGK